MNLIRQSLIFIQEGGVASCLILFAGLVLLMVAAERIKYLFFSVSTDSEEALKRLESLVGSRAYFQAIQLCNQQRHNVQLEVLRSGLIAADSGREAMKSALGASILEVTQNCEARLSYLALIASAGTLLGLLGTITGLIQTFAGIANSSASEKARLLGTGIAEAMHSTAAGLVIGLVAMVAHTVCMSKADSIISKSQNVALKLIHWIEQSERPEPFDKTEQMERVKKNA